MDDYKNLRAGDRYTVPFGKPDEERLIVYRDGKWGSVNMKTGSFAIGMMDRDMYERTLRYVDPIFTKRTRKPLEHDTTVNGYKLLQLATDDWIALSNGYGYPRGSEEEIRKVIGLD